MEQLHQQGHKSYFLLGILYNYFNKLRIFKNIVGDSGYPLRSYLLTPAENAVPHTPEENYNLRHCSTRSLIEQCNGVLKMRFRCLLKHRVLHYSPERAAKLINACAVLHNICVDNNVPHVLPELEDVGMDYGLFDQNENVPNSKKRSFTGIKPGKATTKFIN